MEKTETLRVVLDTNVVLYALSPRLHYQAILQKGIQGDFEWWITTEILLEYEEKVAEFFGLQVAHSFIETLLLSSHVKRSEIFFHFNLLDDPDDNKFVDCAVAANAHFLVSEDKVFLQMAEVSFPKINWVKSDQFLEILNVL